MRDPAQALLAAFDGNTQLAPLSEGAPIGLEEGYMTAAGIAELRRARGERVAGRKIGFTNRTIWPIYNVDRPVWGWVWESGLHDIPRDGQIPLPARPELRLEPEIAFGIGETPAQRMGPADLLGCIAWVAHSVELVCSLYPGWRFTAPDAAAAQAMHAELWVGERIPASRFSVEELERFSIRLTGGERVLEGHADDVLGGPLHALAHLVRHVGDMPGAPPLQPGEIITTGTLTDAVPLEPGAEWQSRLEGIDLPALDLRFSR